MHTKLLMNLSALFMALLGITSSFLPQEILAHSGIGADVRGVLLIQIIGALYLGFAILNWAARGNLIGGIYSRPVALGNFFHFAVVGVVLLKALMTGTRTTEILVGAVVYAAFAIWFGLVLFMHPRQVKQQG